MFGKCTGITQGESSTFQSRMMGFPIVGCGLDLSKRTSSKFQGNRAIPADNRTMLD